MQFIQSKYFKYISRYLANETIFVNKEIQNVD